MSRKGSISLALVAFAALLARPVLRDEVALAPGAVKPLEKLAKEVAKGGRGEELDELLDLLRQAGMEVDAHTKLAAACRADAAKAKKIAPVLPSVAKELQKTAAALALQLRVDSADPADAAGTADPTNPTDAVDPAVVALARFVLRLDSSCEAAQRALGREKVGNEWLDAAAKARRARQAAIGEALARARTLAVEVETGPSHDPLFERSRCATPHRASAHLVEVHGVWPAEKLARVLRESLRALAVDQVLVTGELAIPEIEASAFVTFDEKREYLAAVEVARSKKLIDDQEAARADPLGGIFIGQKYLGRDVGEAALEATLHSYLIERSTFAGARDLSLSQVQVGITAGLTNWTSLAFLGDRIPGFTIEETKEEVTRVARTSGLTEEQRKVRERLLLLAEAGITGGRAWLQWLAAHREDPPFENALVDQIGRLQGLDLLKATFVFERLAQDGPVAPLLKQLPLTAPGKKRVEIVEAAFGRPLNQFEAEWREWLLPEPLGLAQRLGAAAAEQKLAAGEQETLAGLQALRHRVGLDVVPVDFDREASANCRKHALYLARNPDQLERWPDAHEEYPDRPGFDPAGSFAGTHSVIAPGVRDGGAALDSWMATFYHRLPLLDWGLVRIGFAFEKGCAVLDCASFVRPHEMKGVDSSLTCSGDPLYWGIPWPPPDASDVPTHFQAELPQPVPGEDESRMGYPITFQLAYRFATRATVELELHSGGASGTIVPCRLSTPTDPTNPKLAPEDAWCLIARTPLRSGGAYTVTGTLKVELDAPFSDPFHWSFRCGK